MLALTFSATSFGANVNWAVVIKSAGGGKVLWSTSQPEKSGTLSKSGQLTIAKGAYVDLTFQVNEGFKFESVTKNLDDWTAWLDSNKHYRFGPVENRHVIVATFSKINPEGSLMFESPSVLPDGVAPIYNATGHYSGTLPVGTHRNFDIYAAMDESGKIDVLPNISKLDGFTSDPSNKPVAATVKTIDNKPSVQASGKLSGTRDGVEGSVFGLGSLSGIQAVPEEMAINAPLESVPAENTLSGQALNAEDMPLDQVLNAEGLASYNIKLKDKQTGVKLPLREKALPVTLPVTTNATRDWSVTVDLEQRLNAKNKTRVYAKALLILPNGEQISFRERVVKYSRKKGYTLNFSKGRNLATDKVDKKTRVNIKKMLFSCTEASCALSDGEIRYRFLGQRGKANLLDFMVPPR